MSFIFSIAGTMIRKHIRIIAVALAVILAFIGSMPGRAQSDTLRISDQATTHIVFGSELTYVDISNRVIIAKVVNESRNILRIKAQTAYEFQTTLSALESNGALHTFIVMYDPHPRNLMYDLRYMKTTAASNQEVTVAQSKENTYETTSFLDNTRLEEVLMRKQELFHLGDNQSGIYAYCENIYVADDKTYLVVSVRNTSNIRYDIGDLSFVIESNTGVGKKRTAKVEKEVRSENRYGSISVAPGKTERLCYFLPRITLDRKERLFIYLYEKQGARNLKIILRPKDINGAVGL